jgi:hypothetical protein
MHSRRVELLDSKRLAAQLASLECRTGRSGKDSVDDPPRSHDDVANAAAGALVLGAEADQGRAGARSHGPVDERGPLGLLGPHPPPPGEAEQAAEYEQASSGLGDRDEAREPPFDTILRILRAAGRVGVEDQEVNGAGVVR